MTAAKPNNQWNVTHEGRPSRTSTPSPQESPITLPPDYPVWLVDLDLTVPYAEVTYLDGYFA